MIEVLRTRSRRRLTAVVLVALLTAGLAGACGETDDEVPTAPDGSRARPTGTVNTTVAPSTNPDE